MDFLVAVEWKFLWSLLLIISFKCNGTLSDLGKMSSPQNHFGNSAQSQFATRNSTRVIAQKGGLAILPCVVKLNSPATVSWIRRRDFQLLTVGLSTHSSDKRFLVEHTRHMGHWSLRIKSVREEDRGFYECQLSIYPTQSIFIELKVVEAVAEITGAPDLHIDEGSTLRLECRLKRATENPAFVFWYHDSKMVNYDAQDGFSVSSTTANLPTDSSTLGGVGGVNGLLPASVTISPSVFDNQVKDRAGGGSGGGSSTTQQQQQQQQQLGQQLSHQSSYLLTPSTSLLTIQEVHFHHAGNYTCAPSNARPASITVHVLRGEKPAAMQHANRSSIFDKSDSHGGGSGGGGGGNNNNNSIGAIGASTSSGMVPFVQNSLLLMLCSSLHLAYWQLCKLFDMSEAQQDKKAKTKRKSSSSLRTVAEAAAAVETSHCRQSSKHFQCALNPPQKHHQQQQQQQQQEQKLVVDEKCTYNLHWVLNKIAVALIFHYHKIES